ncbi:hypothetical protein SAMN04487911_10372 [Arenibacter nanhaiticus]|uniref:DUF2490 domain-containing protein n=1 Tax=Arenibacter nanhaiticus TaxID=558155 RepID=A0A1M6C3U9_9FLAO|nr:DUF2490 domain-containing protein [Arenibacter nanhaiticus]SHI55669.1 hypothetical protein SAMN04487911_10372 [Arenibacter nanhaiticus]
MFKIIEKLHFKLIWALKKTRLDWFAILVMFTLKAGKIYAQNSESGIAELWQELYVYKDFNQKWRGEILFNNLYSSQFGNYDWFLEGKTAFKINEILGVEAIYRQEYYDLNGSKGVEYRPMIRFSGKFKIRDWSIRNRHRIELRMFEIGETRLRYRTDFKIKPNFNWTNLNLNPYVLEEIFINQNGFSRNRVYVGIEGKKWRFEPAIYMLLQSNIISDNWDNQPIVGIMMGFEL